MIQHFGSVPPGPASHAYQAQQVFVAADERAAERSRRAAIGIDFGGTNAHAVVLDDAGRVVAEEVRPTPKGVAAVSDLVAELVLLLDAEGLPLGVGAPVLMDADGLVLGAPNLPSVIGTNVRRSIEARLSEMSRRPSVFVMDNDATCAAFAEAELGCAQGSRYAVVVTLGTGIGGGLIVEGSVVRGAYGLAGEAGHMIVDPDGPPCPCGRRGCWERYASGTGFARLARDAAHAGKANRVVELAGGDPEAVRGEHVSMACSEGDADALAVMSAFAWWVALGLANLAVILDLELCVIGGGPVASGDLLLTPVREHFSSLMMYATARPPVEIVLAALGSRAGAVGAGWMAWTAVR